MSLPLTTDSIAREAETWAPTKRTHQAASSQAERAAAAESLRTQAKARRLGFCGRCWEEEEVEGKLLLFAPPREAEGGGVPAPVLLLFLLLFPLLEGAIETLSQCSSRAARCVALAACAAAPSTRVMVAAATEA